MTLPNFPISLSVIWHLQRGLPHQGQTCARQRSPGSKSARPAHISLHVTYSPSSSRVSQLLKQGKPGLSILPPFPSLKQDSCLVSNTCIRAVIPGDCLQLGYPMMPSNQLGMFKKENVVQRCFGVNGRVSHSG